MGNVGLMAGKLTPRLFVQVNNWKKMFGRIFVNIFVTVTLLLKISALIILWLLPKSFKKYPAAKWQIRRLQSNQHKNTWNPNDKRHKNHYIALALTISKLTENHHRTHKTILMMTKATLTLVKRELFKNKKLSTPHLPKKHDRIFFQQGQSERQR